MNLLLACVLLLLRVSPLWASALDCDFETDWCGWTANPVNPQTWFRANKSSTEKIDPGRDHTCSVKSFTPFGQPPKACGMWLSTIPPDRQVGINEYSLVSPPMGATVTDSCFTFWYHFFGMTNTQFEVRISNQNNIINAPIVWQKLSPQSNNWVKGTVNIPKQATQFYIVFHSKLDAKFHDTVGLDDISMTFGACPPTPDCDLETDTCGWTLGGGAVRTNGTPINDHTTNTNLGHYVLNMGARQTSTLSIPLQTLATSFTNNYYQFCLSFWYNFGYVRTSQDITSYINISVTTYSSSSSYTKQLGIQDVYADGLTNAWRPYQMTVPNPNSYSSIHNNSQVVITLYSSVPSSLIAIDDLLLKNKQCGKSTECDFESDFCSWSNQGTILWLRNQGGNQNGFKKAPTMDTTTHTPNGWFAMVPLEFLTTYYVASLASPPLYDSSNYDCLSFDYWAVGLNAQINALTVVFYDLTKYNKVIATYNVNTTTYAFWRHFHTSLPKLPPRFSVVISTNYNPGKILSDIAIDQLDLASDDCDNDQPWKPSSTTPIPYTERKWDCNFEYACPTWSVGPNWVTTSYRKVDPTINAPKSDKTYNTPEGQYLLWMPSSAPNDTQTQLTSTINSTALSTTSNVHCFSFWYYDASEVLFELDVQVKNPSYTMQPRSVRPNVATRSWKFVKVDIRTYIANSFISLRFRTGSGRNGTFAFDDFKVVPGECGHIDDYVYTFDSYDNLEVSRISPLNSRMGVLHGYSTTSYPKAPQRDHTTGTGSYFLFMNMASDANVLYKDELVLDNIPAQRPSLKGRMQPRCFRFAYQVSGNVTLDVYIASSSASSYYSPKFTAAGAHTNWVIAQMPYSSYNKHKMVFRMSKPFDTESYVAIDDIQIASHNCRKAVECDFDDDVCSYTSRFVKADYDFARYVGPPSNPKWPGPAYDHTKRGYGGGYLYMTGFPSKRDATRYSAVQTPIETFPNRIYSNYCVSFFTQITQPDAILTITLGLYGGEADSDKDPNPANSNSTMVQLVQLTNLKEIKWTRHFIEINRKTFDTFHEYNLIISGKTTKANTVIAIDDVELSKQSCNYAIQFKCKNGQKIDVDKTCDFKKDCTDGSDELDCGECDFESDLCGWENEDLDYSTSLTTYQGRWRKESASNGLGPKTDGNGSPRGHYLVLEKMSSSNTKQQMFISTTTLTRDYEDYESQFKDAYLTCTMTFDYYLNSIRPKYSGAVLRVRVGTDEDSSVLRFYANNKGDSWQKARVLVGAFAGPFVVQFTSMKYGDNETVALDNVQFHNCSLPDPVAPGADCPSSGQLMCNNTRICIDPGDLCDFEDNCGDNWDENYDMCVTQADAKVAPSCAFEKSIELCGFSADLPVNNSYKIFNWQYTRGYDYNLISYGAPGADHTTKDSAGQYLILRTYQKPFIGKSARLYGPMVTSSGGDCILRFFYSNNGNYSVSATNQLRVWAQYADGSKDDSTTLFTSNTYAQGWNKAKVNFNSGAPFRFVFQGQLSDTYGSISLDDVSFSGTCISSSATRTEGKHSGSAAVTVILVLLLVGLLGGVGFFAFRKHQAGELVPFFQRIVPSRGPPVTKSDTQIIVNPNHDSEK